MNHSDANRPRHPRLGAFTAARIGLGSATAFAAVSVALVAVVACSAAAAPAAMAPATTSPEPSEQPVESPPADPSVAPSPIVAPSASPHPSQPATPAEEPAGSPFVPADLEADRIGRVVATDGLRVRTMPTTGEGSKALEPTLDEGTQFYVVDGPIMADGYAWYQVDPYGADTPLPFGWVAAGSRDGSAWIKNHLDGCDTVYPSVELLGEQAAQESLYCYGSDELELTGNLVCDFGDIEGLSSGPAWIESDRYCELRAPDWNIHDGISLRVWGQAATSLLEEGSPVDGQYTVIGHFDDAAASECESAGFDGQAPDPAEAVLNCRMMFVVTEVTPA